MQHQASKVPPTQGDRKSVVPISGQSVRILFMRRFPRRWIIACVTLALTACGLFKSGKDPDPKDKPNPNDPKSVGRIASIPADKRFVLIQSYGKWNVSTGTILTTRGPENRSANLLVTGESLGQFAAADLQSGLLDVGDAVYSRHIPKPSDSPDAPVAPTDAAPQSPELPQADGLPQM